MRCRPFPYRGLRFVLASVWWTSALLALLLVSCRARRAPDLPEPDNFVQLLFLAAFVLGLGWLLLKILRG